MKYFVYKTDGTNLDLIIDEETSSVVIFEDYESAVEAANNVGGYVVPLGGDPLSVIESFIDIVEMPLEEVTEENSDVFEKITQDTLSEAQELLNYELIS